MPSPPEPATARTVVEGLHLRVPWPAGARLGSLRGRRIVLDPGHGGPFPGAVGREGAVESEVNLTVALHLYGLLRHAGAEVSLTRLAEAAAGGAAGRTGGTKADLEARARGVPPDCDLFVSLHHDARPEGAEPVDESAVYYRLLDGAPPGASSEAARCVVESLEAVFRPSRARVLPGNYLVLRESACPAILGEPMHLTHPGRERMLGRASTLRLEAECYFAGIAAFFSRGLPRVASFEGGRAAFEDPRPVLRIELEDDGGAGMDATSVSAELDGSALPRDRLSVENGRAGRLHVTVRAEAPLSNGPHGLRLRAQNRAGNPLPARRLSFAVDCAPSSLELRGEPPFAFAARGGRGIRLCVTASVRDRWGRPAADGRRVRFRADGVPEATDVELSDGEAEAEFALESDATGPIRVRASCGPARAETRLPLGSPADLWRLGRVLDAANGAPVSGARIVVGSGGAPPRRASRSGRFCVGPIPADGGDLLLARAPGYLDAPLAAGRGPHAAEAGDVELSALFGGALLRRRIFLEASGDAGGATVAERLLSALTSRLEVAGARVLSGPAEEAAERVRYVTESAAEAYVRVQPGRGGAGIQVCAHPGAREGQEMSRAIVASFDRAGARARRSTEPDFVCLHAPCPAVILRVGEDGSSAPSAAWTADRVVAGLAGYFRADPRGLASVAGAAGPGPPGPAHREGDGWSLVLDGSFSIPLSEDWTYRADLLPPGERVLSLLREGTPHAVRQIVLRPGEVLERVDLGGAASPPPRGARAPSPPPSRGRGCLLP